MNYGLHYNRLVTRAALRPMQHLGYVEKHHVTPRCLGGSNAKNNLVKLTAREHYVAHQLLAKMHPWHPGLQLAMVAMTWGGGSRSTNRKYSWMRQRHAKAQALVARARFSGVPKSESQRARISQALKGRKVSPETKLLQSRSRKERGLKPSAKNIENRKAKLAVLSLSRPDFSTGEKPVVGVSEPRQGRFRWTLGARYTGTTLTKSGFKTAAAAYNAMILEISKIGHLP